MQRLILRPSLSSLSQSLAHAISLSSSPSLAHTCRVAIAAVKQVRRRSNDPFWCLLPEEGPPLARRAIYGEPILEPMPSNRLWECLDIAGPSTLGALNRTA